MKVFVVSCVTFMTLFAAVPAFSADLSTIDCVRVEAKSEALKRAALENYKIMMSSSAKNMTTDNDKIEIYRAIDVYKKKFGWSNEAVRYAIGYTQQMGIEPISAMRLSRENISAERLRAIFQSLPAPVRAGLSLPTSEVSLDALIQSMQRHGLTPSTREGARAMGSYAAVLSMIEENRAGFAAA